MKKNKSMRLAGGLMIATLLSTSVVSGTYAKYVTSDSASDSARVAKFGVTVQADGTLFGKNYLATTGDTPTDATTGITVKSSDEDNVVAPGTKNDTGMTFSVKGTPEVAVKVDIAVTDVQDIFLGQKTALPDMTTGNKGDTFDNAADYYPVKFTLTQNGTALVRDGTLAAVGEALSSLTMEGEDNNKTNIVYSPGTKLDDVVGDLKLTWEWAFEAGFDKQDTLLGDLAAGTPLTPQTTLTADTDYCLDEAIEISVTVTQVD